MQATEYITETYLKTKRLKWQATSRQWTLDGAGIERNELIEEIRYDAPGLGQSILGSALTRLKRESDRMVRQAVADLAAQLGPVEPDPERGIASDLDDSELDKWLRAVTGLEVDPRMHEANMWAMKQWLWQVMRNAQDLEVTWHVMPIIYSRAQGTGKSRLIDLLTSPLKVSRRNLRSVNLQDQFYVNILGHTLIGVMDEFAGSGDVERLAAFKSLITAETLMARTPHKADGVELKNIISLIGSSNLLPPHGVNEEGGSRRIHSIHGSEQSIRHDKERRDLAESITPAKIWKAVDWRIPCLHDVVPDRVLATVADLRRNEWSPMGLVTGWYTFCTVPAEGQTLAMDDARDSLNRYAARYGYMRFEGGKDALAVQLRSLGAVVPTTNRQYPIRNRRLARDGEVVDRNGLKIVSSR